MCPDLTSAKRRLAWNSAMSMDVLFLEFSSNGVNVGDHSTGGALSDADVQSLVEVAQPRRARLEQDGRAEVVLIRRNVLAAADTRGDRLGREKQAGSAEIDDLILG